MRHYEQIAQSIQPQSDRAAAMQSVVDTLWEWPARTGVSWIGFYTIEPGADHMLLGPRRDDLARGTRCPACDRPGGLRPHVVWFGEMPLDMDRISAALGRCGLFMSIGTSGNVYPAAGFVREAQAVTGAHTVELNLEPSEGASDFAEQIYGLASAVVPAYVRRLLDEQGGR